MGNLEKIRSAISQRITRYATTQGEENLFESDVGNQPDKYLYLAIWFGLITGFAEVFYLAYLKFFRDINAELSIQVIWMAPLADVIIFVIPGIFFWFLARRWPKLIPMSIAVFIYSFLGFSSLLLLVAELHKIAVLLLAFGLSVQVARLVSSHPKGFFTIVRSTISWRWLFRKIRGRNDSKKTTSEGSGEEYELTRREFLISAGAIIGGLALGVSGWTKLVEQLAYSNIPTSDSKTANVLLIVLDTVRAQNLSVYNYNRPTTPQLDKYARSGVVFDWVVSTCPWTLPSHASMFTGRFPYEHGADWDVPLDDTYPTLAEVLKDYGYATAGFVANLKYCSYISGLNRGFIHYEDFPISPGQVLLSSSLSRTIASSDRLRNTISYHEILNRKTAAEVNHGFLRWLTNLDHRPFFAFLNYMDAHEPYLPRKPFDVMYGQKKERGNYLHGPNDASRRNKWDMSSEEIQVELNAYDGAISYIDHQIGLLIDELDDRGVLENTLVIITSDHGEQFGEHRLFGHGNSLYVQNLRVPLLISFPGHAPINVRIPNLVSLRDLPATILDILGLGLQGEARLPGNSLAQYWKKSNSIDGSNEELFLSELSGGFSAQDWYPHAKGDMKSLMIDRHHYILNGDGREELYDLVNDPLERQDLAASNEIHKLLNKFKTHLETIVPRSN